MNPALHFLIIEDNNTDIFLLKRILKQHNYGDPLACFKDGSKALDYFKDIEKNNSFSAIPDFIFLDINMPIMDGFTFIDNLMKLPKEIWGNIKILILTSSDDSIDIKKAAEYELVKAYLTKPFNIKTFNKELQKKYTSR